MMKQVWTRQRPVWRLVRQRTTVMVLRILVWGGALFLPRVLWFCALVANDPTFPATCEHVE